MNFKFLNKSSGWETLVFLLLFIFSIVFSYERIIQTDPSFYLFKLINFSTFNIEHGRYSAFISQIPVATCIKIHVPLKYLIPVYSASFILLFYGIYLVLQSLLKNKEAASASVLLSILGVSQIQYQPVAESIQGLYFSLILYAYFYYSFRKNRLDTFLCYFIPVMTIILCYFSHPTSIFTLLFIAAFYVIDMNKWKSSRVYLIGFLIIVLFSIKLFSIKSGSYEGERLPELTSAITKTKDFLNAYPAKFLFHRLLNIYLFHTIFLICILIYYFYKKQFLKIVLVSVFISGFLLIHNLSYFEGGSDIEMEKNMMTLSLFIFIPFARDIFPVIKSRKIYLSPFWMVLIIFSSVIILKPRKIFQERITCIKELIETSKNSEGRKFYVYDQEIDRERIMFTWTSSIETLFYSSLQGPMGGRTIYVFNDKEPLPDYIKDPELYLMVPFWLRRSVYDLNPIYFKLPVEEYRYLQLNKSNGAL